MDLTIPQFAQDIFAALSQGADVAQEALTTLSQTSLKDLSLKLFMSASNSRFLSIQLAYAVVMGYAMAHVSPGTVGEIAAEYTQKLHPRELIASARDFGHTAAEGYRELLDPMYLPDPVTY